MASTSSIVPCCKYDVVLSFRGSDTGEGFTSHLFAALVKNQIETFNFLVNNNDDDVKPTPVFSCLKEIEESCISIVVFSKNYAESEVCLEELARILECVKTMGQMVLPVFYQVDPTDVQELTGSYGAAMAMHEEKFKGDTDKLATWTKALKEISNISGRALQDTSVIVEYKVHTLRSEAKLIEEIVNDIWKRLELLPYNDLDDRFVGLNSRIKEVESLLRIKDVLSIGLWGMGGIGKTALAENLFNRISTDFEGQCFVNVREELERCTLVGLRDKVISAILKVNDLHMGTPSILPKSIRRKLQMRKVLVVLDDVNSYQELETLVGQRNMYGSESKLIVTARNKQVLQGGCDRIFEVKKLGYHQSMKLFKRHAFKQNLPSELLMDLTKRVLKYVDGIPLALKVLACSLYAKGIKEWVSMLEKLEKIPDKEITQILRISFDCLEDHEKNIFLDIACFFFGYKEDEVMRFWDVCGFYPAIGIRYLEDQCLIEVSSNRLTMHALLRQMGQDIVRQESIQEPGERSRLWDLQDIYHALSTQRVSEKIEGISLDMLKVGGIELSPTIFSKMCNLRMLRLFPLCSSDIKILLPNGLQSLPDELRLLHWFRYPLKSLPSKFGFPNLVELKLQDSKVEQLWDSNQSMGNLKIIELSRSRKLFRIPDLYKLPNLEVLNLRGCIRVNEIPSSIGYLRKLTYLTLDGCTKLEEIPSSVGCLKNLNYLSLADCSSLCNFPSCEDMINLEFLSLQFCSKLAGFPKIPPNVKQLDLSGTAIQEVPSSIGQLSRLCRLGFGYCTKLKSLPSSIGNLQYLDELYLVGCPNLANIHGCTRNLKSLSSLRITFQDPDGLPETLSNLESLEDLFIVDSSIKEVPSSIGQLSKLKELRFCGCKSIAFTPFSSLNNLSILHIMDCGITEIPYNLGSLTSLTEVHLREKNLEILPSSIKELSKLLILEAQGCKRLQVVPELPSGLKMLDVYNCSILRRIPALATEFNQDYEACGEEFNFGNCFNLDEDIRGEIEGAMQHKLHRMINWMFSEQNEGSESDEQQQSNMDLFEADFMFCIPGRTVTRWFEHQNIGSSLTVTADSHKILDLRRLAFCAVVSCNGIYDLDTCTIKCDLNVVTKSGRSLNFHSYYQSPSFLEDEGERVLQSDHVFIWYHPYICYDQNQYYFTEATLEFYAVDWGCDRLLTCDVISCGVSIVGKKNGMSLLSYEDEDDEEENEEECAEPAPKRLRINEGI